MAYGRAPRQRRRRITVSGRRRYVRDRCQVGQGAHAGSRVARRRPSTGPVEVREDFAHPSDGPGYFAVSSMIENPIALPIALAFSPVPGTTPAQRSER